MKTKSNYMIQYNILRMEYTTHMFLIWSIQGHASAIAHLSHPGLKCLI